MSQLYTVRMKRKILVYRDGQPPIEELVDETYHDLPLSTAHAYRAKFGSQVIAIEPSQPGEQRRRRGGDYTPRHRERNPAEIRREPGPKAPGIGFHSGTYADAISKHIEMTAS